MPSKRFEFNTKRLSILSDESYTLYKYLQNSLKEMRKMGIPSIGNPVLKLENEVLTLVYRTMQHQTNCELYATLISEHDSDIDLQVQLNGLYEMTEILSNKYVKFLDDWKNIEFQQKERIVEITNLSIPA